MCDALRFALSAHGAPTQILTDNGKVFTARFGKGPGPVLFDRICHDNGIRHLLTAPYSPTTTGKVERFHKTLRAEFFTPKDRVFTTIEEAQPALDDWVELYNTETPPPERRGRPPVERFALARTQVLEIDERWGAQEATLATPPPPGVARWVDQRGRIALGGFAYRVGPTFIGEPVEVVCRAGLIEILHAGVLVATHAERRRAGSGHRPTSEPRRPPCPSGEPGHDRNPQRRRRRLGQLRGRLYRVGAPTGHARSVEVAIVASRCRSRLTAR